MDPEITLWEKVKLLVVFLILAEPPFHLDLVKFLISSLFRLKYLTNNHTLLMVHNNLKIQLSINRKDLKCSLVLIPHLGCLVSFNMLLELIL